MSDFLSYPIQSIACFLLFRGLGGLPVTTFLALFFHLLPALSRLVLATLLLLLVLALLVLLFAAALFHCFALPCASMTESLLQGIGDRVHVTRFHPRGKAKAGKWNWLGRSGKDQVEAEMRIVVFDS